MSAAVTAAPRTWLSVSEAARIFDVSESQIRQLCRRGKMPYRRIGEKLIRIPAWAVANDALAPDLSTRDR